jgi:hypothetical protein
MINKSDLFLLDIWADYFKKHIISEISQND